MPDKGIKNTGASGLGVLFTGYMEKQNPIRKSYSKRFLVLTHEAFYWFRRPDNTDLFGEERGSISLSAILSVRRKDEYSFDIEDTAHGHRFFRYIARTGAVAQCDEWITQIRSACKKLKEKIEQTAREKRKKKGSGSLLPLPEGGNETDGDEKKSSIAVRMVTLKNNGVELVMARNPIWERLIRIPMMTEGDVVLISTSNGGQVTLSRAFMLEKAMKTQDLVKDLFVTDEDPSSIHTTTPQANFGTAGAQISADNEGNSGNNIVGGGPGTPSLGYSSAGGEEIKADTKDGKGVLTTTASSTAGISTSEVVPTTATGFFVDVPILNSDLPSSLKLSVSWINDDVDSALKSGEGYDTTNPAHTTLAPYGLYAYCFDVFRQALKDSGDNITLMLALMSTVVGITSLRAVDSSNSLLFMFCMCLAVSVLYTAIQRAKIQVEQDRIPRRKQAEMNSDDPDSLTSAVAGAQSFHLIIAGHSFTSPDQPVVQAVESIPQRFINACDGDVEAARRRFETTSHWRETEGVNTILVEPQPHFHHIKNFYPHYNAGEGREGTIIYWERPGELMPQIKQLHSRGIGTKEMLRHWLYITEYQFEVLCKGDPMAKGMSVIDVKGVGVFDFMGKTLEFVKKSVQVAGQHYPERSFVIYIVNANAIFTTIWSIVKGWIHENTVAKVRILGPSETLSGLQEHIDISQIPEYYGGGLKFGDDKDGCRYHAPQSEGLYELVRRVNCGEVTQMHQVYALYNIPNPDGTPVPQTESASATVAPTTRSCTNSASAVARRQSNLMHSPIVKGDTGTPPRRHSVEQKGGGAGAIGMNQNSSSQSLLDNHDSDDEEVAYNRTVGAGATGSGLTTPMQQKPDERGDFAEISPLTVTPASQQSSGLRSRRGRETKESSSSSPDRSPASPYDHRIVSDSGAGGTFKDSPESRASGAQGVVGSANSTAADRSFSDYYEY